MTQDPPNPIYHLSPDDIMRLSPALVSCVLILIEACRHTTEGRIALDKWDEYRVKAPNYNPHIPK